jgi:4-diphosphocytidyl-2-C-methyl-D-erythritol kinase
MVTLDAAIANDLVADSFGIFAYHRHAENHSETRDLRIYNHSAMKAEVRAFAKINLGLGIGAKRADGFHELLTVYQMIGLHDVVRVSIERGAGIEIRCEDPRVPKDESNTCFRILERVMQALAAKGRVVIEIEKRLPVQGGLGGASSNAVAALLGLERALRKRLPSEERLRIAAEVGSDLPLFLIGGTVLGVGRGEQVYPLEDLPSMACVVITPEIGVSTPKAFAEWDRRIDEQGLKPISSAEIDGALSTNPGQTGEGARSHTIGGAPLAKLTLSDASDRMNVLGRALSARLSGAFLGQTHSGAPRSRRGRAENPLLELVRAGIENDFEQVVFPEYPELREGKRALELAGAEYASLSGSGSALYGLFASRGAAASAAARLRKQGWKAQATSTLTRRAYWKKIFD